MTVEQIDVVDGVGLSRDGSVVELLISDHLGWNDPRHIQALAGKVEAYANAALSGQLVQAYPLAEGKQACIRLVYEYAPDSSAKRFLTPLREQLATTGIEFEHGPVSDGA
jgi:hypothetical protein